MSQKGGKRVSGKNGPRKQRTLRRTANEIKKDWQCQFCEKCYGSEAACIMHMRNKHGTGTKQDMERETGLSIRENLLTKPKKAS